MTDEEKKEFKCLKEKMEMNNLYGIAIYLYKESLNCLIDQISVLQSLLEKED